MKYVIYKKSVNYVNIFLRIALCLFAVHAPLTVAYAASITVERSILTREILPTHSDLKGYANSVTFRYGGENRASFLKQVEIKYAEEGLSEAGFSNLYLLQQLTLSTTTTKGNMQDGLSIFSLGISGIHYTISEELLLEYAGLQFSTGHVKPLYKNRIFLKGLLRLDYFYSDLSDEPPDKSSTLWNARGEISLIYSYPQFDIGASYVYRMLSVEDSRTQIESDVGQGYMLTARYRF